MKGGRVRKKIIAHEETKEHKVIDDALEIEGEGHFTIKVLEFEIEVLSSDVEFDELELDRLR